MPNPLPDEAVNRISDALFAGRKIEAIKTYRQATGVQLKDAKDFIDALEARLRQESPEKFTVPPGGAGCSRTAVLLGLFCVTIYFVTHILT